MRPHLWINPLNPLRAVPNITVIREPVYLHQPVCINSELVIKEYGHVEVINLVGFCYW